MAFIGNTPTQQAFTAAVDVFSGNGSTTAFTLSRPVASVAQVEAVIENVQQSPVDAYTVSGNTITFTSAPPSGSSNIYVRYTSPITQVIAPTDGSVTAAKLAAGAARANFGAGAVLQVLSTVKSDAFSLATATFTDVTGLSVSITPSSSSSKILVLVSVASGATTGSSQNVRIMRNSTPILVGDAASTRPLGYANTYSGSDFALLPVGGSVLDSPSTTSAVTYKIQVASSGGTTTYVNRSSGDRDTTGYDLRGASSITVMEIAA